VGLRRGGVRCPRAYYYCPHCRRGHCPWEAALRVDGTDLTPGAREAVRRAGLLSSFAEAAAKVLPKLAGLRLAESTVERTTEAAGAALGQRLRAGETFGPARDWRWPAAGRGRRCAYASVDATGVGLQGAGGAAAEGKMAYVGLIFAAAAGGAARSRAAAGLCGLADLGERMRRQGAQVGMDRADGWVALTDGGAGLEEFLAASFPRGEGVLDFYHAAGHLNAFAKALHPADDGRAAEVAGAWCHTLKHAGGAALRGELEALDLRGRKAEVREAHRRLVGYVQQNEHRMDYPRYRADGWLLGSGHIEAACKAVVGQRLKGNGMRWSAEGADAVCHLRALFTSEKGQWDAYWNEAA
jgi:hypothetical protein